MVRLTIPTKFKNIFNFNFIDLISLLVDKGKLSSKITLTYFYNFNLSSIKIILWYTYISFLIVICVNKYKSFT